MKALAAAVFTLALFAAACGSDSDEPITAEAPAPADAPAEEPAEESGAEEPVEEPAPEPEPEPEPPAGLRDQLGLATIQLDAAGGEPHPELSWSAADGAVQYQLVVLDAAGAPYWAWQGPDTVVRFGGSQQGGGQTAVLHEPMTWSVLALDDAGAAIAVSDPGDLQP